MDKKQLLYASSYGLVTFPTTHNALHAEKVLDDLDIPFIVVPTPREISASCGLAVRFFEQQLQLISGAFLENNVSFSKVYSFQNGSYHDIGSPISKT